MRKADIVSGLILLTLGLVTLLVIIPAQVGSRNVGGLPPDFFPRLLNWLILGLTILLLATRLLALSRNMPSAEPADIPIRWAEAGYIVGMGAFLFTAYQLMAHLGFVVAGVFAVLVVGTSMGSLRAHPIRLALTALIAPFAIFWIFRNLFSVFLPG